MLKNREYDGMKESEGRDCSMFAGLSPANRRSQRKKPSTLLTGDIISALFVIMPRIIISDDLDSFSDVAVQGIHEVIQQTAALGGNVSIGLSGGSMPVQISPGLLALKDVDWRRVHFFFCDERVVPFNSPDSTYGVYKNLLFDRLPGLPTENVHKICVEGSAAEAAAKYQSDIMAFFGTEHGYPAFDLLLLGIGPDGHTCSLFPNHKLLSVEDLVVAPITDSPKPPPNRVTLTLPVINKSKHVAFLVAGRNKAEAVTKIIQGNEPKPLYPASLVQPLEGQATWYLDRAAAQLLKTAN
ncbi:hypothetical protein AAHC03_013932 [Spirometra sp. Aus1]